MLKASPLCAAPPGPRVGGHLSAECDPEVVRGAPLRGATPGEEV